jgi:hypothetical protein
VPTVVGGGGSGSAIGHGLITSGSVGSLGGSFFEAGNNKGVNRVSVGGDGNVPVIVSPITPPNHFFELSMVSGEPQWEWTTYRCVSFPLFLSFEPHEYLM